MHFSEYIKKTNSFFDRKPYRVASAINNVYNCPPIDIRKIVKSMGVEILQVSDPGWQTAICSDRSHATIWVDESLPEIKKRYGIAFQFGRLLMSPFGEYRNLNYKGSNKNIVDANKFAHQMLVPAWHLDSAINHISADINKLADIFNVSPHCIKIAMAMYFGYPVSWT